MVYKGTFSDNDYYLAIYIYKKKVLFLIFDYNI